MDIFRDLELYFKHLRLHGNMCYFCGKGYRKVQDLGSHALYHIREKLGDLSGSCEPIVGTKCYFCNHLVSSDHDFYAHMKDHAFDAYSGKKCQVCQKEFQTL